jgi:WD40 repeat protein
MSEQPSQNLGDLDVGLARRIDAVCRRFEADWREGRQQRIEGYLDDVPDEGRPALRAELGALERELRQPEETVVRPEAGHSAAPEPETAPNSSTIAEAPTIAPRPSPTSPVLDAAPSSVDELSTLPPSYQPGPPHDQPTAAMLGQDPSATPGASEPNRIRYFGDYEIIRELARGGMGVVFQARQVSLNRTVALKMILAGHLANDTDVKRFYTEAEAAANLDHPGIVPIYEVGQHEGQHYFSMGFVEGQSLSQRLADGPLPPRQAAALIVKVAEAIEYAHQRGVIHRDLKPHNILLDQNGNPRVTDFGLAKKLKDDSRLTGSGQIMGTPSYMPPEQAGGKRGDVGLPADVYALGATLYALITGRPPFQAATAMDTVLQVISDDPVPPRRLNASVPIDLETICLKCLEKEPGKRYVSAEALGEDLCHYLAGEPIGARPVGRAERAWRWCKRNRAVAALLASVLLITVLGSVGVTVALIYALRAKRDLAHQLDLTSAAEGEARDSQRATAEQLVKTKAALLNADTAIYRNDISMAQRSLAAGDVYETVRALGRTRPEFRSWEYAYLEASANRRASAPPVPIARGLAVAFSPDGTRLALAGPALIPQGTPDREAKGIVTIVDAASGREQLRLAGPGRFDPSSTSLAFHPAGRRLATASDDKLCLWDLADGRALRTWPIKMSSLAIAFSPDGARLAAVAKDGMRTIWDTETGTTVLELEGREASAPRSIFTLDPGKAVAFSPDGSRLAATFNVPNDAFDRWVRSKGSIKDVGPLNDAIVKVWDAKDGRLLHRLNGHRNLVHSVVFSPDGRWVASAAGNHSRGDDACELIVWDAATGKPAGAMSFGGGIVGAIAFSNDSRTLAACSDGDVRIWEVPSGRLVRTLSGHRGAAGLSFHPGGGRLATAGLDPPLRLWNLDVDRDSVVLKPPLTSHLVRVTIGPEGRRIAAVDDGGRVLVWADGPRGAPRVFPGASFAFPATPEAIAVAGQDGHIRIFNISSGDIIRDLPGHAHMWGPLAFVDGGRRLITTLMGRTMAVKDMTTELRDLADGRRLGGWTGWHLAIRPDGSEFAVASEDGRIAMVAVGTAKERLSMAVPKGLLGILYSPDGRWLVTSHSPESKWPPPPTEEAGRCRVWDARDGRLLEDLEGEVVGFHPGGSGMFIAVPDGRVRLVGAEAASALPTFAGHEGKVSRALVTPDRRRLITASHDTTIRIWDLATGQSLLVLRGHNHVINDLALAPDGAYLISASHDSTLCVWPSAPHGNSWPSEPRSPVTR